MTDPRRGPKLYSSQTTKTTTRRNAAVNLLQIPLPPELLILLRDQQILIDQQMLLDQLLLLDH